MWVDAHQHFWTIGEHDCQWPTEDLTRIYRDFTPADLLPLTRQCGIEGTVLVQSQPSLDDTRWLLDVASRTEVVRAVVGWVDLKSADAPARIVEFSAHGKLRGFRPMLQNLADDDWILDSAVQPAIHAMIDAGLSFDALILPRHLPVIRHFAERYRQLPIVIDHAAKPDLAAHALKPWDDDISILANLPNVHCKISGLVTEAAADWQAPDLSPCIQHLCACFGTDKLMWGSDWPVLNLAGDYSQWWLIAQSLLPYSAKSPELAAVMGDTARRFYRF